MPAIMQLLQEKVIPGVLASTYFLNCNTGTAPCDFAPNLRNNMAPAN